MATEQPEVQYDREYSKNERLELAKAHYHADYQRHLVDPAFKKPIVSRIAKLYDIVDTMLGRHVRIGRPQMSLKELHIQQQALTVGEETALAERLLFLDDFNVPADKRVFYELAHNLLHRRDPDRILGRDWIYRFLERHLNCRYVMVKAIASTRANAIN